MDAERVLDVVAPDAGREPVPGPRPDASRRRTADALLDGLIALLPALEREAARAGRRPRRNSELPQRC